MIATGCATDGSVTNKGDGDATGESVDAADGKPIADWNYVTGLILSPGNKELPERSPQSWNSAVPTFRNLRWEGGEYGKAATMGLGRSMQSPTSDFIEADTVLR